MAASKGTDGFNWSSLFDHHLTLAITEYLYRSTVSKRACASVWVWATNPGDATVKVNLRAERRENLLLEEDRNATANLRTGWPAVFKVGS